MPQNILCFYSIFEFKLNHQSKTKLFLLMRQNTFCQLFTNFFYSDEENHNIFHTFLTNCSHERCMYKDKPNGHDKCVLPYHFAPCDCDVKETKNSNFCAQFFILGQVYELSHKISVNLWPLELSQTSCDTIHIIFPCMFFV